MGKVRITLVFSTILALFAVILIVQPVCADNGSVSIAYSGSGGNYIGDIIFFNGRDTAGNLTLMKISGPGLPAAGVPVLDLNGKPGTGNSIEVNPDGSWKFLWYSASAEGTERLQTGRYTFTIQDVAYPGLTATTSILLKKPEFSLTVKPSQAGYGDYVELIGNAEQGSGSVRVDVVDTAGKISHTFMAPVGADGYFDFGFHVDMQPGQYTVTVGNPSMGTSLNRTLTILSPAQLSSTPAGPAVTPGITPGPEGTVLPIPATPGQPVPASGTGSIQVTSTPPNASVLLDSAMAGITPITLTGVTTGQHIVAIRAPGYIDYSVQVTVNDGERLDLSPTLIKSPSLSPLPPAVAVFALIISGGVAIFLSVRRRRE